VTDGLPVVPPTRARVEAAIAAAGRPRDEVIALVAPALGRATIERIAVNAVMAGCRPEYLPVVIAGVEAMCDEGFSLVGVSGTTDAVAPIFIVNGPARSALGINAGAGALGPGHRANATIGRALRLIWVNLGGARAGAISMSSRRPHAEIPGGGAPEARRRRRHRRAVHRADPGLAVRRLSSPARAEEDRAVTGRAGARADTPDR